MRTIEEVEEKIKSLTYERDHLKRYSQTSFIIYLRMIESLQWVIEEKESI
jgi:hypothetical protein